MPPFFVSSPNFMIDVIKCYILFSYLCLAMQFRKIISWSMILLVTFLCFKDWITVVQFKANRSYVARYLCVNRNNPSMKCNGKCFLMKKLKAGHKQSNQNLPRQQDELRSVYYTITELPTFCLTARSKPLQSEDNHVVFESKYHTWLSLSSPPPEYSVI